MTKAAAMELAPRKVRVNSVHPGTDRHRHAEACAAGTERRASKTGADQAEGHRRRGRAAGAVPAVGESHYITGAEVAIDGGITA